jgi:hypothetical protein
MLPFQLSTEIVYLDNFDEFYCEFFCGEGNINLLLP